MNLTPTISATANIHDVAALVVELFPDGISTMKLQKLVYLAQGWHLGLTGTPLVTEQFEAWESGPVSRELLEEHRGQYTLHVWPAGDSDQLTKVQKVIIEAAVNKYGALSGLELSHFVHVKATPWKEALRNHPVDVNGAEKQHLKEEAIRTYFTRLLTPTR